MHLQPDRIGKANYFMVLLRALRVDRNYYQCMIDRVHKARGFKVSKVFTCSWYEQVCPLETLQKMQCLPRILVEE